jgi:hypothetical protein
MMRFAKFAFAMLAIVSLLFLYSGMAAGDVDAGDCHNLTGEALQECLTVRHQRLEPSRSSESEGTKSPEQKPLQRTRVASGRTYGYTLGDMTEFELVFEFKKDVEFDLKTLPASGAKVGEFVVRSRIDSETFDQTTGTRTVKVRYLVQNFAVRCEPTYVPFGPFEVQWREVGTTEWQRLEVPGEKILVSPVSRCNEVPDPTMAPSDMLDLPLRPVGVILFTLGFVMIAGAFAVFGFGFYEWYRRMETSPLWRAMRVLSRPDVTVVDALSLFRTCLREKFGIAGSDTAEDVRAKVRAIPYWREYAAIAAGLWEEATAVLYDEAVPDGTLVERIRAFVETMLRREKDEA